MTGFFRNILSGLSNLEYLDVSHNNLTDIDADICKHLPNIEEIYLGSNLLTDDKISLKGCDCNSKQYSIFSKCSSIKKVELSGNKISKIFDEQIPSDA